MFPSTKVYALDISAVPEAVRKTAPAIAAGLEEMSWMSITITLVMML